MASKKQSRKYARWSGSKIADRKRWTAYVGSNRLADQLSHLPVTVSHDGRGSFVSCNRCSWFTKSNDPKVVEDHIAAH